MQGMSRCSGGSLQGSIPGQGIMPASPHQAPHLPERLLWKAPQPWHIQQHQGGRHLPVPSGFCMAVPRGWHQLCLSPALKAMWTSLQQSPHPSKGVNTSSLIAPRRFHTALCMNSPAPFPTTGPCAISSQGNLQCTEHAVLS